MFSSKSKSLKLPSYESTKLKLKKSTADKFVDSDKSSTPWFTDESLMKHACRSQYSANVLAIGGGFLAAAEIVLLATVPIILWLVLELTISLLNLFSVSIWTALIINTSRIHEDSITQSFLQLLRHPLLVLDTVFWFLYLFVTSIVVFIISYSQNNLSLVSSVSNVSFFGPSPFVIQILFMFLGLNVVVGIFSAFALVVHAVIQRSNTLSSRYIETK